MVVYMTLTLIAFHVDMQLLIRAKSKQILQDFFHHHIVSFLQASTNQINCYVMVIIYLLNKEIE